MNHEIILWYKDKLFSDKIVLSKIMRFLLDEKSGHFRKNVALLPLNVDAKKDGWKAAVKRVSIGKQFYNKSLHKHFMENTTEVIMILFHF